MEAQDGEVNEKGEGEGKKNTVMTHHCKDTPAVGRSQISAEGPTGARAHRHNPHHSGHLCVNRDLHVLLVHFYTAYVSLQPESVR